MLSKLPKNLTSLLDRATEATTIPVAVPAVALGLAFRDSPDLTYRTGWAELEPNRRRLSQDTWFDLASLTKVMFTTPRILQAAANGQLDLDAPVTQLVPDYRQYHFSCPERSITPRQCLGHRTPLPAVAPLYTYGQDQDTLRAFILQREFPLGTPTYSDINFILLGFLLERLEGRKIGDMNAGVGVSFRPDPSVCAATEFCSWRRRMLVGEVHDENAFALGGAGHAGLFGTLESVLAFGRGMLEGTSFHADIIARMREPLSEQRTHGFERKHKGWAGGDRCSEATIGHTGFTGTGLWIDFERGVTWVLLTNRVHPSRHRASGIQDLRRQVGNAVADLVS